MPPPCFPLHDQPADPSRRTLPSLDATITDLALELEGANRQKLSGSLQLIVQGQLLIERPLVILVTINNEQLSSQWQKPKGQVALQQSVL